MNYLAFFPALFVIIFIGSAFSVFIEACLNASRFSDKQIDEVTKDIKRSLDKADQKIAHFVEAGRRKELKEKVKDCENFHAMEVCPKCEHVAVHPFVKEAKRWIGINTWQQGVIRECVKCKFTWKQY